MTLKLFNTTIYIKKEIIAVIAVFIIMLMALAGYLINKRDNEIVIYTGESENTGIGSINMNSKENKTNADKNYTDEKSMKGGENEETNEVIEVQEIKIYIIGCVNNPGIITLEKGQMVYEAIEAAGGATKEADLENINMVYKLEENVMLNILPKDKVIIMEKHQNSMGNDGDKSVDTGAGIQIIRDEGDSIIYTGGSSDKGHSFADSGISKKVNINTASIAELDTLPGIGRVTAEGIIKYRQQYGKFEKIEDIMKVSGIKENKFEKIKEFITVD